MPTGIRATPPPSRVGLQILVTNRGMGKTTPVEGTNSVESSFKTQRDPHSELSDASIELSLYSMDKNGKVTPQKHYPPGKHVNTFA